MLGLIISAVTTIAKALGVAKLALDGLKVVGNILTTLGKALGLIKPETKTDALGDKAIQSGYNPENYNSYEEYVKAVESFETDPEKSAKISPEEKYRKGIELSLGVIKEKYGEFPIDDICIAAGTNPEVFNESRMSAIGTAFKENPNNITSLANFINGTEHDDVKLGQTMDFLTGIEKIINPQISDKDALKNILSMCK